MKKKIKNYKQFTNENLIWDNEEGKFFDMNKMEYISLEDIVDDDTQFDNNDDAKYSNMSDTTDLDNFRSKKFEDEDEDEDSEITIELLRGKDILRAFNYTKEIDLGKMGYSCCHFNSERYYRNNLDPEWFDFYVKNPDSCGTITMFENGKICGRASFFEGVNQIENRGIKKGEYYKFFNVPYLYSGKKYEKALIDWVNENDFMYILRVPGLIFIPFNTRVVEQYPPLDVITVNVKDNLLCSSNPCTTNIYGFGIQSKVPGVNCRDYHTAYKLNIRRILDQYGLELED